MYTEDISKQYGIDQFKLEEFLRSIGYNFKISLMGKLGVDDKDVETIVISYLGRKGGKKITLTAINGFTLDWYYKVVKHLFVSGVLYIVQDFLVNSMDDYYDLTSYKLDLALPIYDGYGRIMREGVLFDSEYVLLIAYSIKTKNNNEEKKNALIHVFNGENGGFAYIENDEKKIYEKKMSKMVDTNGKNIIEVYTSLLEPDATSNLINQAQNELIQQAQNEQARATGKAIGTSIGAVILGASAASLGRSVRQLGRSI